VQMTRKRIGQGLLESFSETCELCKGRGLIIYTEPVGDKPKTGAGEKVKAVASAPASTGSRRSRKAGGKAAAAEEAAEPELPDPVDAESIEVAGDEADLGEDLLGDDEDDLSVVTSSRRRSRRGGARRRTRP